MLLATIILVSSTELWYSSSYSRFSNRHLVLLLLDIRIRTCLLAVISVTSTAVVSDLRSDYRVHSFIHDCWYLLICRCCFIITASYYGGQARLAATSSRQNPLRRWCWVIPHFSKGMGNVFPLFPPLGEWRGMGEWVYFKIYWILYWVYFTIYWMERMTWLVG